MIKILWTFAFINFITITAVMAQGGNITQAREKQNAAELSLAGLVFNVPTGFHQLNTEDTGSMLMDSEGRIISPFRYVLANADTSIAIGVYYTADHQLNNIKEFNTSASGRVRTYVDTLADNFKRYDKTFLAVKWHTDFGIEYSRPMQRPFMNRFLNNRIVYIASPKMELKLVYFYSDNQTAAIANWIKKTSTVLAPVE